MNDIDPNTPEILFMTSLKTMLRSVGIHKMFEAMDYFKLMEEAVTREIFNKQNPDNTARYKEHRSRQAFIKIFQSRYKILYDIEYEVTVTEKDAHAISILLKKLEDNGIPIDIYLEWFFDEYVPQKRMTVESISYPCSSWTFQAFKLNNKDKMGDIKQKQLDEKERIELFEKSKEIIRSSKIVGNQELCEEVLSVLKDFNGEKITLEQFRNLVASFVVKSKAFKDKKLQEKNTNGSTVV